MARRDPLLKVQVALTDRDHRLLGWLYDHGVLTTDQIAHALFPSLDFTQRRLLKLLGYGVVDRFRPQRPDGGSYPYHYVLDQLGVEVVAAQRGDDPPRRNQARQRRHHLTSRANLTHLLGVNQFFIDLAGYARTRPATELARWWPASHFHATSGFVQEDDSPHLMLTRKPRPDGHGVWTERDKEVPFYLEYDLATERLETLLLKVDTYHNLTVGTGRAWPLLFWLPGPRRETNLHQRLAQAIGLRVPVATATSDYATAKKLSPAEEVWWLHGHEGRSRLADLPVTVSDPA